MKSTVELRVESLAAGGDGVARSEGLVVFVPRSAPGDVGIAEVKVRKGSRFARAELQTLRVASPDRVEPICCHYTRDRCGGCQLQHISYESQLRAKARIISDAFERLGRRSAGTIRVRPSSSQWRYRRKLTLALRRRGRIDQGPRIADNWIAGLHPFDDPARVFTLEECPITNDVVLDAWRAILQAESRLPDAQSIRGAVRVDENGTTFVIEGGDTWPEAASFALSIPVLNAVWWTPVRGMRRLVHGGGGNARPGASFMQVNAAVAEEVQQFVVERTLAYRPGRVIDAYAGIGETAISIASLGIETIAIELDADAAQWCGRRLPSGSRAIAGRAEDLLGGLLPADVILLNPPRAGVDARVCAALEGARDSCRAILYVSCDPATLARDVARLPGYAIARLEAFDMFPQTAHVEAVCELIPGSP